VNAAVFVGEEQIAEIERVHFGADDDVDMVVIETDGVAEIGGREVELGLDQLELQAEADGATSFQLAITEAELDAMPDFDESEASDYPLSDNPAE
jgi:hypothetical protein